MGLLKYVKRIRVGGKWFFKRGRAKKTNWDSRRRERTGMQQLRLRVDSAEGRHTMLVITNEGNDDLLVDGVVLPAGCCIEHLATPHFYGARFLSEDTRLYPPIIDNHSVCYYPPTYDAALTDPPPIFEPVFPPILNAEPNRVEHLIQNMRRSELVDTVMVARAFHGSCNFSCVGLTAEEIKERIIREFSNSN